MQAQRKFGAPAKRDAMPGERFQLGVRVTPELKHKLDAAAELSGRSQSQEAELRLEHSFDRQALLPDVLNIAYGNKKIAGLVMTLGAAFVVAGRAVAGDRNIGDWTSDPAICDIAIEAAHTVLESFRPAGKIPWADAGHGAHAANVFIKSVRQDPGNPAMEQMREVSLSALQAQFEGIAERLAERLKRSRTAAPGSKQPAPYTPAVVEAARAFRRAD